MSGRDVCVADVLWRRRTFGDRVWVARLQVGRVAVATPCLFHTSTNVGLVAPPMETFVCFILAQKPVPQTA
eukprot:2831344-Lingulodinium_polyedra.AAC.1